MDGTRVWVATGRQLDPAFGTGDLELGIGDDPAGACRKLVDLSGERGGADHLTAVMAHVRGDGPPEPTPSESIARTLEVIPKSPGPA